MNNPLGMIFQTMRCGGNPQAMLKQMLGNNQIISNPIMKNAIQMYQNGDTQGLQAMAENLAKERGTTVNDMKSQIMAQFGMK